MSNYYLKKLVVNLTVEKANEIITGVFKASQDSGLLPLTVAVLDAGGNLVAFQREDGSGIARQDIAKGKAWGALGMGISSRTIRDRLKDRPAFQGAIAAATQGRFIAVPGGVLICNSEDQAIGAVGISGDASDKDEYCAITAVREAGFIPHPEKPAKNWSEAGL